MEKDIGKINKNDTTDIMIRVDDFGGVKGVTIREFVTSDRYTGFTKSGVRIMGSDFPKFKEMINAITDEDLAESSSESNAAAEAPGQEKLDSEKETTQSKSVEDKESLPDY
jgi:hypothetical protein